MRPMRLGKFLVKVALQIVLTGNRIRTHSCRNLTRGVGGVKWASIQP